VRRPRPDLIVTAGRLNLSTGNHFLFRGQTGDFVWRHHTENQGTAAAPKSRTAVKFIVGPGVLRTIDWLAVPRLAPGKAHTGLGQFAAEFVTMGTFPTRLCADSGSVVTESNEANNCGPLAPVYVIPRMLEGSVGGSAPLNKFVFPGVTISWQGTATFRTVTPRQFDENGVFDYPNRGVTLQYSVTGTNSLDGCSWNGSATYHAAIPPSPADRLRLQFGRTASWYVGQATNPGFHFSATVTCGTNSFPVDVSPQNNGIDRWIDTGIPPRDFPDPGLTTLTLHYVNRSRPHGAITYEWNLTAT
jgi:hypothetical protein